MHKMVRKIFLLAGKHKTGTTSVQNYLDRNEAFLNRHGIAIVRNTVFAAGTPGVAPKTNCFLLAHMMIRGTLLTPVRLRGYSPEESYDDQCANARTANRLLRGIPGQRLIISAEALSFLRTARERHVYDMVFGGFEVCPIVCFRKPRAWMASWKKQVHDLRETHGRLVETPGSIFDFSENSWLVDDAAIRGFFGPDTCALSYEDEIEKYQSVIPAIMNKLGFSLPDCPSWDDVWDNRSRGSKPLTG